MADNVKNWTPWDLDKLYWPAEVPRRQLAIVQGNKWVLAITDWVVGVVADVIDWDLSVTAVVEEDPDTIAVEILKNLNTDLAAAIEEFKKITWTEYPVIKEWIMAIESCWLDIAFPHATLDNIDIFALFLMVHEYDMKWQIDLFKWLFEKIKTLSPLAQAYILWFNELTKTKCSRVFPDSFEEQQKRYEKALEDVINLNFNEKYLKLIVEKILASDSLWQQLVTNIGIIQTKLNNTKNWRLRPWFDVKNPATEKHFTHLSVKWVEIWRIAIWDRWYPQFWDKIIKEIDWVEIKSCNYIHSNPITWEISWEITSIDDKKYLFVWDRLIRTIWWKEVTRFINIHTQPNWTLAWGIVAKEGLIKNYLSDGIKKTYLFVWDTLIDTIWEPIIEHIIEDCYCIHTQPNWTLAWRVTIWGKKVPFIWNKIIHSIWWEEVEFCESIHTLIDWRLAWTIKLQNIMYPFVWDEIMKEIWWIKIEKECYLTNTPDYFNIAWTFMNWGKEYRFYWKEIIK